MSSIQPPRASLAALLLLTGTALSSCGSLPEFSDLGQQRQAVSAASVDDEERWAGVVHLKTIVNDKPWSCTGTLVAPNLVVTALHCMAPLTQGDIQCTYEGESVNRGVGSLGSPVAAEEVSIRVGFEAPFTEAVAHGVKLFTTNSSNICTNDLALVQLDRDLDLPLRPLRLEKATARGEPVTIVGYGMTDVAGDKSLRRYRSDVRVLEIGNDANTGPRAFAPPRTLSVEPSACQGDSGGPALAQSDDFPIVGVNSLVLNDCGLDSARGIYTRLAPFKNLILEAFSAAGHEPWLEGEPEPGTQLPGSDSGATTDTSGSESMDSDDRSDDDSSEAERPASSSQGRRLTSGCAVGAELDTRVSARGLAFLGLLAWGAYGLRRRRP